MAIKDEEKREYQKDYMAKQLAGKRGTALLAEKLLDTEPGPETLPWGRRPGWRTFFEYLLDPANGIKPEWYHNISIMRVPLEDISKLLDITADLI